MEENKSEVPFLALQGGFHNPQLRKWQSRGKQLTPDCFMFPIFISREDDEKLEEIPSFPGQFKVGKKKLVEYLKPMVVDGLKAVLLFPVDMNRGDVGWLYNKYANPVIEGIGIIKNAFPHVTVACDVCLCGAEYNGLCYIMTNKHYGEEDRTERIYERWLDYDSDEERFEAKKNKEYFTVDQEGTMYALRSIACTYAMYGADIVAPSDMNDGRVGEIDRALTRKKLRAKCAIMSYSAKFASCMYGPFRDTCSSKPIFNSREGKQLPVGSSGLANRAVSRDVAENADIIMVKPATMYLDVVRDVKKEHPHHPVAAYQVSGEYAMLFHSAKKGVFDLKTVLYENFHCMQRAGVDIIISYFTPKVLKWLKEDQQEQLDFITKQMNVLEEKARKEDEE